jgi:hypothetical protein
MFSETRYALNGDLRVAYRASREGPRDIVFVPNWFTCCEALPELPSTQGWVEAMTSLGRLIFFDHGARVTAWRGSPGPSASWGPPRRTTREENHGMQADGLRATGTFAWVVHDALSTVALGSADGRANSALHPER